MNYVESFKLFGTDVKQIPCIPGSGAPTESTEGAVGCLYMDTKTGNLYKCRAASQGVFKWEVATAAELADVANFLPTKTASGNPIEITDFIEGSQLRSVKVIGATQAEVEVSVSGKNLLTLNGGEDAGVTCEILEDGGIHVFGTPTAAVALTVMPTAEFARLQTRTYTMRVRGLGSSPVVNNGTRDYRCGLVLKSGDKTAKFDSGNNPDGAVISTSVDILSAYLYLTIPSQFKGTYLNFTFYPTLLAAGKVPTEAECADIGYTPRQEATIDIASQTGWKGLTLYRGYTKVMSDEPCNIEVEYIIPTNDAMDTLRLGMSRYYGEDLIYTAPQADPLNGITLTPDAVVAGKYTIAGKSSLKVAFKMALYQDSTKLPPNILRGNVYRIGKYFPVGTSMEVYTIADGEEWKSLGSVSRTNTKDIAIPDNAVGMRILLAINPDVTFAGVIETEMVSVSPVKYAQDLVKSHHPDVTPPPMLTIIDDDGYMGFQDYLMDIVTTKKISIASAIPIEEIETKPDKVMSWNQIESCALAGAEILSHTYSNLGGTDVRGSTIDSNGDTVLTEERLKTDDEIAYDYRLAQAHLRHHGINSEGLVFVKSTSLLPECVEACKKVYKYGFKADCRNDGAPVINYKGSTDRYGIQRNGATFYDLDALKLMINDLCTAGTGWLVWMLHTSINEDNPHKAQGGAIVNDTSRLARWDDKKQYEKDNKTITVAVTEWAKTLALAIDYALSPTDDAGKPKPVIQIVSTEYGVRTYCD